MTKQFKKGDYVAATKWEDGDLGEQYCVGCYDRPILGGERHMVTDNDGSQFRANGFRRVQHITHEQGVYIIEQFNKVPACGIPYADEFSFWDIVDASTEPRKVEQDDSMECYGCGQTRGETGYEIFDCWGMGKCVDGTRLNVLMCEGCLAEGLTNEAHCDPL